MNKEQQIEEIAKVIPEKIKDPLDNSRYIIFGKSLRREIARVYYNAGYQKLPEDSVVLSRERYDYLTACFDKFVEIMKDVKKQARKEMAKEIYGEIEKSDILIVDTQEYGEIEVVPIERLNEIFRSKGVEVEE